MIHERALVAESQAPVVEPRARVVEPLAPVVEPLAQVVEALAQVEVLARLDERAAGTVESARRVADDLHSSAIGPEHMLLALLTDRRDGSAASAGNSAEAVSVGSPTAGPEAAGPEAAGPEAAGPEAAGPEAAGPEAAGPEAVGNGGLVFTPSCEAVLVEAGRQARGQGDGRIGTEHLLLGLLTATGSTAVRQLFELGTPTDSTS